MALSMSRSLFEDSRADSEAGLQYRVDTPSSGLLAAPTLWPTRSLLRREQLGVGDGLVARVLAAILDFAAAGVEDLPVGKHGCGGRGVGIDHRAGLRPGATGGGVDVARAAAGDGHAAGLD